MEPPAEPLPDTLTPRDYFAGQALAGLLGRGTYAHDEGLAIICAWRLADQMMACRSKDKSK